MKEGQNTAIISNAQSSTGDPATGGHDKAPTEQHETDGEYTNIEVYFLLISLFWQEGLEQHKRNGGAGILGKGRG